MGKRRETWAPVRGFPGYEVSDLGRVRSLCSGKVLSEQTRETGHRYVQIRKDGRNTKLYVHAAMLRAFVGLPPPGHESRHLDGDSAHNRLGNLAWGTRQENCADKALHGRQPRGAAVAGAKLTAARVREIRRLAGKVSQRTLAQRFGVSHTTVRKVMLGVRWAHV